MTEPALKAFEHESNPIGSSMRDAIPPMTLEAIEGVRKLENILSLLPQKLVCTHHVLHGGMYSRTMRIPAGFMITGALIKVPTLLIIEGDALVWTGEEHVLLEDYNIIPAHQNRKQVFVARTDVLLTMIFATKATTIEQAEEEFTDDFARLLSRQQGNKNFTIITGA